ncbi:MAG: hypothetical protein WCH21_09970, partial [Bacteroidota bacterium]
VISMGNINTEMGRSATASTSLSFIKTNTLAALQQASPNLNQYHSYAWFKRTNAENCNMANCTNDCNCGYYECVNCTNCYYGNCGNCDATQYLQTNCNCNYACYTGGGGAQFWFQCFDCLTNITFGSAPNCDCGGG